MRARRGRALALAVALIGCSRSAPAVPDTGPAPVVVSVATAAVEASVARVDPGGSGAALPAADVERLLDADFAKYAGGSSFAFLRDDWAPRVARYVSLRDVPVEALVAQAKGFYADKTAVSLKVAPGSVRAWSDGEHTAASFVVRMLWMRPVPASWGDRPWAEMTETGMVVHEKGARIHRDVSVRAHATLDDAGRLLSYDEDDGVVVPQVVAPGGLKAWPVPPRDPAAPASDAVGVPERVAIDDLGEFFVESLDTGMQQAETFRHVRLGGRELWADDGFSFVSNGRPMGTSFLEPVK
jgi:hypothetical protein